MIESIRLRLLAMQDLQYRDFQAKLVPTVKRERIIGVRTPALRAYAKELCGTSEASKFLADLPHDCYEEDNLHAFLIECIRDYDSCIAALNAFLPHIDNWATCDSMHPKILDKYPARLMEQIHIWLGSEYTYAVRFGMGMLMRCFLDKHFQPGVLEMIAAVESKEYYIRMMTAWFFATALAKQWDAALPYICECRLDPWTHNKAIQKAVESRRISPERKEYLKKYRNKES